MSRIMDQHIWRSSVHSIPLPTPSPLTPHPSCGEDRHLSSAVRGGAGGVGGERSEVSEGRGQGWTEKGGAIEMCDRQGWTEHEGMQSARAMFGAVACNGRIYVLGGRSAAGKASDYTKGRHCPSPPLPSPPPPPRSPFLCLSPDPEPQTPTPNLKPPTLNGVAIPGLTWDTDHCVLNSVESFDPREGFWRHEPRMQAQDQTLT